MSEHTFDTILDALARGRQRATYSAVAAVVNGAPRTLMQGRPRDARHSWVVSVRTGVPTGYDPGQLDPELEANPQVLQTGAALREWLAGVQ